VIGPFGTTFLMPNHPKSHLVMICTGTGSAPMRAMTEWRRRLRQSGKFEGGKLMLFFGARTKEELPYFGPLQSLPKDFIDINFAFSRTPGAPKRYVQDVMRERAADLAALLKEPNTYFYVCGLKSMEEGVVMALRDVVHTLAERGVTELALDADGSRRGAAARKLVTTEAAGAGLTVVEPARPPGDRNALLVVSGWADAAERLAHVSARPLRRQPIRSDGTWLAPWLLTPEVVDSTGAGRWTLPRSQRPAREAVAGNGVPSVRAMVRSRASSISWDTGESSWRSQVCWL